MGQEAVARQLLRNGSFRRMKRGTNLAKSLSEERDKHEKREREKALSGRSKNAIDIKIRAAKGGADLNSTLGSFG